MYDFGEISAFPNGDLYANINLPKLGNINLDSIENMLLSELKSGLSWRMIRNVQPCNDCIYKILCPPPSNYDFAHNKVDLCLLDRI